MYVITIGSIIEQYINSHGMSMTAFANKAGLSTAYISMLIKGRKSGQIPVPTLDTYKALAAAMGMSTDDLLQECGVITISPLDYFSGPGGHPGAVVITEPATQREMLLHLAQGLTEEQAEALLPLIKSMLK